MTFEQYLALYQEKSPDIQAFIRTKSQETEALYEDLLAQLNPADLFENYSFLQNYRYTLIDYLRRIEQTQFKMTYKVKYMQRKPVYENNKMTDKGLLIDVDYPMQEFQSIFEVSAVEKNRIVLNLKSPLGKLLLHNMLILDTDWCPESATDLSKNAYFIYKRFILSKVAGKHKSSSIRLKLEELTSFLDLNWSNISGVYGTIGKALDDLIGKEFIVGYRIEKRFKQRIYRLQLDNQKASRKKKAHESGGNLLFN